MKLIRFSIIAFVLMLSVQFAKAQSISVNAHFGRPYHHVVYARGYYGGPAYYGHGAYYNRRVYYGRPRYYRAPVYYNSYYRAHRYYRHW
jgi:hypothetical protein